MLRFQAHWSQWKDSLHWSLGVLQEIHPDLGTRFLMAVWRALYIFIDSACELWEIKTNNDFWYTTAFRESTEPNSDDIQENYLFSSHELYSQKIYTVYLRTTKIDLYNFLWTPIYYCCCHNSNTYATLVKSYSQNLFILSPCKASVTNHKKKLHTFFPPPLFT